MEKVYHGNYELQRRIDTLYTKRRRLGYYRGYFGTNHVHFIWDRGEWEKYLSQYHYEFTWRLRHRYAYGNFYAENRGLYL